MVLERTPRGRKPCFFRRITGTQGPCEQPRIIFDELEAVLVDSVQAQVCIDSCFPDVFEDLFDPVDMGQSPSIQWDGSGGVILENHVLC